MKTNLILSGIAKAMSSRLPRLDTLSLVCRQSVLGLTLVLLTTLGVGNAWADAPTLEDLSFGTPAIDENFNSVSTTSTTAQISSISTSQSGYGIFNHFYNNNSKNQNTIAISASGYNMTSNYFSLSQASTNQLVALKSGGTFSQKGAWRVTVEKTSYACFGLYNSTSQVNAFSRSECSAYVQINNGAITIQTGSGSSVWTPVGSATSNTIDICVIYNLTNGNLTYGDGITLNSMKAHVYINGTCVNSAGTPTDFSMQNNGTITCFRANTGGTGRHLYIDDIKVWNALPTAAVSCSNTVTLSKGSESNGTLTLGSTSITTCNATASTRQVTITVAPSTGYATPSTLSWTKSSGTVNATKVRGPTGSSSPYSYVYQFDQDDSGSGTFGVTCTAKSYTVTLNDNGGSGGDGSVTVTYNANTNLTSAVTVPTRTGYDFNGYRTSALTTLIDEDGNWLASKTGYTDASKNWVYADDVTLNAYWTVKNYTVTWKVNNTNYTTGSPSDNVNHGSRVAKLPTDPDPEDYCGQKFVGWTDATDGVYVHGTSTLFTTAGTAPVASGAQIFYAVFADYDE